MFGVDFDDAREREASREVDGVDPLAADGGERGASTSSSSGAGFSSASSSSGGSSSGGPDGGGGPCVPKTCAAGDCGTAYDGCQGTITCAACTGNTACGVDTPNRCTTAAVTVVQPASCPAGSRKVASCSCDPGPCTRYDVCLDSDIEDYWVGNLDVGSTCPAGHHAVYSRRCAFTSPIVCVRD